MKRKTIGIIGLVILVSLIVLNFYGPYNILNHLNAKNLANNKEFQEQVEGNIVEVKYIGSDFYQVKTDETIFLLKDKSDYSFLRFEVFKPQQEIEIFKNPM